ncbi:MAG: alpha/beta hydrolase [Planctomycetes bacterium]|nr:alpha/beta hydrolase [Planctomycetota bacterium]
MKRSAYAIVLLSVLGLVSVDAMAQRKPPGSEAGKMTASGGRRPKVVEKPETPVENEDDDSIMVLRDIVYSTAQGKDGESIGLKLDVAFPKTTNGKPLPVVVYIHGGGYKTGSKSDGLELIKLFAQGKYFAVSIDYRLSDVAPFPAAIYDCKAAIRFLRANSKDLGIDSNRIGVFGHSAGGHLSALLAVSSNDRAFEGNLAPKSESSAVKCVVDVSGPIDFLAFNEETRKRTLAAWLGTDKETYEKNAEAASPLTYIDSEDPPILIIHGVDDKIVPIEHAIKFNKALKEAGVKARFFVKDNSGHMINDADTLTMISHFMDKHLRGAAGAVFEDKVRNTEFGKNLMNEDSQKEPPASQPVVPVDPGDS